MKHSRQSTRLRDFDYTQAGTYFITIVTYRRRCLFGKISDCKIILSRYGGIALYKWFKSTEIRHEIELHEDEFVVMPNHIHGIVWIIPKDKTPNKSNLDVRAHGHAPLHVGPNTFRRQPKSLSSFVAGYKASVTKQINVLQNTPGSPVWMRNYHDRIIRNDQELTALREYIRDNPLRWDLDRENPKHSDIIRHP